MDQIEPSHFDAVVVTSGLPEVLIASALARAGRSVLVLDAADSYGGSWSSLSGPDFVHQLINQQLEQQQQQQQQQAAGEPQTPPPAAPADADPAGSAAASLPLQPVAPLAGASGVALHTHPRLQEALASRGLIIDLAPKVLYQDEALVQLLVSCQAHNYLEFKLVEGSHIFQGGRLVRVAASRADLFADKSLSLADKRALGRFLTGCLEAQQGFGRLKDAFNQQPLVELLQAEGLSRQLQDTVLYGIAMADTPQQQQQQQEGGTGNPATADSSSSSGLLTAADGLAALQLYSSSLGRYGGSGAFMAPCYGCGSLPEAFVRLAAVQGAVTALRHAATQLLLLPPPPAGQLKAAAAGEAGDAGSGAGSQAAAAAAEPADGSAAAGPCGAGRAQVVLASGQRLTADVVVCCQDSSSSSSSSSSDSDVMPGPAPAASMVAVARAVAVVEGSVVDDEGSLLLVFPPGSLAGTQAAVIRGLQLGPSLAVAPPGKFLLYLSAVLPPGLLDSCSCSDSAEQILRPALSAIASLEGLAAMRLSSSSGSSSDEEEGDVRVEGAASSSSCDTAAEAAAAAAASPAAASSAAGAHEPATAAAAAARSRPQVLAAVFFTTHQPAAQQQRHIPAAATPQQDDLQPPPGDAAASAAAPAPGDAVLWCPAAPAGLISYQQPVQDAEAAFRQRFPQLPWLTEPVKPCQQPTGTPAAAAAAAGFGSDEGGQGQAAAGDDEGSSRGGVGAGQQGGGGGGVLDDDELDAIDELTAALAGLSAPP